MRKYITMCIAFVFLYDAQAQQQFLDKNSELEIQFSKANVPYYTHIFKKGNSIYTLARTFGISVSIVEQLNNVKAGEIEPETKLIFPINENLLVRDTKNKLVKGPFIPLIYKAKKGETLYRISKGYCGESPENIKLRNNFTSDNLGEGQKVIIGWMLLNNELKISGEDKQKFANKSMLLSPLPAIKKAAAKEEVMKEMASKDTSAVVEKVSPLVWQNETGVALWDKDAKRKSKLFVLHHTARINSEIELYNPMVNRRVRAKVIGRIPEGAYTSDIDIILSPATALSLGALDSRFMLAMKYVE